MTGRTEESATTFFNEDNEFGVLKVKAKGHRDLVTVVGTLPSMP